MKYNKYENTEFPEFYDSYIDELYKCIGKKPIRPVNRPVSKKPNVKNCLSCTLEFKSEGKHNRICAVCRKENGF